MHALDLFAYTFSSNIVQYRVLSGTFNEFSRSLVRALRTRGLWTEKIRTDILASNGTCILTSFLPSLICFHTGSLQNVEGIPDTLKAVYRTAFELDQHDLINMALDRSPYIDQSQSLNLFMETPTIGKMSSMYLYAWQSGVKTTYYARSRPATRIAQALEHGWVVSFPQGTTSPYAPVRKGTAHIIKANDPIVVPIVINGFRRAFDKKGLRFKKRNTLLTVKFKEPLTIRPDDSVDDIIALIRRAIEQEAPEWVGK